MEQAYLPGTVRQRIQELIKERKITQAELAAEIGMAYPMPSTAFPPILLELIPITSPFIFSSAPPELPGLIAASVWINAAPSSLFTLLPVDEDKSITLSNALITPRVTDCPYPNALPMAIQQVPLRSGSRNPPKPLPQLPPPSQRPHPS